MCNVCFPEMLQLPGIISFQSFEEKCKTLAGKIFKVFAVALSALEGETLKLKILSHTTPGSAGMEEVGRSRVTV